VGASGDAGANNAAADTGATYLFTFSDEAFTNGSLEAVIGAGYTGGKNINLASQLDTGDYFGASVSLAGNQLAVGAYGDDGAYNNTAVGTGAVYLFTFSDAAFTGGTLEAVMGAGYTGGKNIDLAFQLDYSDWFGFSLSLSGNRLVVGAPWDDGANNGAADIDFGAAYLFTFSDAAFTGGSLEAVIGYGYIGGKNIDLASQLDDGDWFGDSLSLSGNRLVVGARGDAGADNAAAGPGAAYLFTFSDAAFTGGNLEAIIGAGYTGGKNIDLSSQLDDGDVFGLAVSLDGNRLAVGAQSDDGVGNNFTDTGAAYLFSFSDAEFNGGSLEAIIGDGYTGGKNIDLSSQLDDHDQFGGDVSLDGNRLAVGALEDDGADNSTTDTGAAYLFTFTDSTFSGGNLEAIIGESYTSGKNIDLSAQLDEGDRLWTVALDGNRLAVGVPGDDGISNDVYNVGAAYLFTFSDEEFTGGNLEAVMGEGYTGGKNIDLSARLDAADGFGSSVSLKDNRLAVGAWQDDGISNDVSNAGAAYLLTFSDEAFTGGNLQAIIGAGYTGGKNIDLSARLDTDDRFGNNCLSLSGNRLVGGAVYDDGAGNNFTETGAAYLFTFSDEEFTNGSLEAIIGAGYTGGENIDLSSQLDNYDWFGRDAALDGNRLAVGASGDDGASNSSSDTGAVYLFSLAATDDPSGALFGVNPGDESLIRPSTLENLLGNAQNVVLQANNDITVQDPVQVSPDTNSGTLTLEAGRSVLVNADISTNNGDLTIFTNQTRAAGAIDQYRDPGAAVFSMAPGTTINTGTGTFGLTMANDVSKADNSTGDISLGSIAAGKTVITNLGTGNVFQQLESSIDTLELLLSGNGSFLLDNISNVVNTLAADLDRTTGALDYTGAGDLTVGTVTNLSGAAVSGLRGGELALTIGNGNLTLSDHIDATGNVVLQAEYDIEVAADIDLTAQGADKRFVLQAGDNITINNSITTYGADLQLEADSPHMEFGSNYLTGSVVSNALITTNGGDITVIGVGKIDMNEIFDAGDGTIAFCPPGNFSIVGNPEHSFLANPRTTGKLIIGQAQSAGEDGLGTGQVTFTAYNITLTDTTFDPTVAGEVELVATNGISFEGLFTTSQPLLINADADQNGTGQITTVDTQLVPGGLLQLYAGNGIDIETVNLGPVAAKVTTGDLFIVNSGGADVTIASGSSVSGLTAPAGTIELQTDGRLLLEQPIVAGASPEGEAYSILLVTSQLQNLSGANSLVPGTGERYLVYSDNPENDDRSGITGYRKIYNFPFNPDDPDGSSSSPSLTTDNNYFLYDNDAVLGILASQVSREYGDPNPDPLPYSVMGLVDGDLVADAVEGDPLVTEADQYSNVGSYDITVTLDEVSSPLNYKLEPVPTYATIKLYVTPAPLTIKVNDAERVYGDGNETATPAFNATFSGFKLDQDESVLGPWVFETNAVPESPVHPVDGIPYYITVTGITNGNYTVTDLDNGTLTITPAPLTIKVNDAERLYGDGNETATPAFSATFSGFKLDQDESVLGPWVFETDAVPGSPVHPVDGTPYTITVTGITNENYTVDILDGDLTIIPAPLRIIADDVSREYGLDNHFTATYAGLRVGDDPSVVSGLQFKTNPIPGTLPPNWPVDSYAILPYGATADNYVISYTNGTLTITPAPLRIIADDASRDYGLANPPFTATYAGLRGDDDPSVVSGLLFDTPAQLTSPVGSYAITLSGATADNYVVFYTDGTLTVQAVPFKEDLPPDEITPPEIPTPTVPEEPFTEMIDTIGSDEPLGASLPIVLTKPDGTVMAVPAIGRAPVETDLLYPNDGNNELWDTRRKKTDD